MGAVLLFILKLLLCLFLILIFLAILLLVCPMWAHIQYDGNKLLVKLQILFLKIRVYPIPKWLDKFLNRNNQTEKPSEKETIVEEADEKQEAVTTEDPAPKREITPALVLDVLSTANEALQSTMEVLSVRKLVLLYTVHGSDAAATAIQYGTFNALFSNVYAIISNYFKEVQIKKVDFIPDFMDEATQKIFFSCKIGTKPLAVIKILLHLYKQLRKAKVL